jgi:hypothetical protein
MIWIGSGERMVGRKRTPSKPNQRTLTPRTPTRSQSSILRIQSISNNVIHRLARHERMRYARLAEQHSSAISQLAHHLALHVLLFPSARLAFEGTDPADISHSGLYILDVELVFETDGEAVQGSDGCLVLGVVGVEGLCGGDGGVEEDLVEAVELQRLITHLL